MAMCKILIEYNNTNNWHENDIVDITNPWKLIEEGKVVLVDDEGNPMERPGVLHCPICSFSAKNAIDLATHIINRHPRKGSEPAAVRVADKEKPDVLEKNEAKEGLPPQEALAKLEATGIIGVEDNDEITAKKEKIRMQRLLNMQKARAAKKAKKG